MGASRASRMRSCEVEKRCWNQFFRDPALWWNNRCCTNVSELPFVQSRNFSAWFYVQQPDLAPANSSADDSMQEKGGRARVSSEQRTTALQLVGALKRCSKVRDLEGGKKLHRDAIAAGCHTESYVAATLITMYSKCRSMALARQVFEEIVHRDVVIWTSLMLGYVQNGESLVAMDLFARMDCEPNAVTFVAALKACGSLASERNSEKQFCLDKGIAFHKQARDCGFDSDSVVVNTLVDMYCKCGSVHRAREVFDRMVAKNVVAWTSLILGYVQNGDSLVAMDLFASMDCEPDCFTYAAGLKACAGLASEKQSEKGFCLEKGMAIHKQVKDRGLETDMVVASSLVDMYSKCHSMDQAREVFDRMRFKNVVTWTSLILGYVENEQNLVAMDLFASMNCEPDSVTYVAALKACGGLASEKEAAKKSCLDKGIAIHKRAKDRGNVINIFVANALVDMYSKCGSMDSAEKVVDVMEAKDVVTWTSLILGYVQNRECSTALEVFSSMDCEPNYVTYVAALKACGSLAALPAGQQIHARLCKAGLEQDQVVANILLDFYGKCGNMSSAEHFFNNMVSPDTVSWNALIAGYSSLGKSYQVFGLAKKMQESGFRMDPITFTSVLTACSHAGLVEQGKFYFDSMPGYGVKLSAEHYACMVDMLGRANRLQEALALVQGMPFEAVDSVTWLTLLGACKKWKNLEVGKVAFDALVGAGTSEAAAYVLMSDIYGSLSMWDEVERIGADKKIKERHS